MADRVGERDFILTLVDALTASSPRLASEWREVAGAEREQEGDDTQGQHEEDRRALIDHITSFVADGSSVTADAAMERRFEDFARERHRLGHTRKQSLHELLLLGEILHDSLRYCAAFENPESTAVAEAARRLHRGLAAAAVIVGDVYEDAAQSAASEERALRERFASSVAHELKNPLGAAAGALENLGNEALSADAKNADRMREIAERSVDRGLELIDDLRALHSPSRRKALKAPKSVREVIDDVVLELSPSAEEFGVRIEIDDRIEDFSVPATASRLSLVNLLRNAIKYSDPDKANRRVRIHTQPHDDAVEIVVADNGVGIPPERSEDVFDRFVRLHPERGSGSGLGLAIARDAVRSVGGAISFTSTVGQGTTFRLSFRRGSSELPSDRW